MRAFVDPGFWAGKRVLITGHTGFKGAWLALWLHEMGAVTRGYALAAPDDRPSLFSVAHLETIVPTVYADVRDLQTITNAFNEFRPEIVFHLAAQALVRRSYESPVETYGTNVMGTVNVLEAARTTAEVKAAVVVTSDKCYENRESQTGYRECDTLGGHDPYSSSKACAELVAAAYRSSYSTPSSPPRPLLATARAGNVIGGGDWSEDRLIPDIVCALTNGMPLILRHPDFIRPWQHVLDPLRGYLLLAQRLYLGDEDVACAWNFGPDAGAAKPVAWLADSFFECWGSEMRWALDEDDGDSSLKETGCLSLDSSRAAEILGWVPRWPIETAVQKTAQWYKCFLSSPDSILKTTIAQINEYTGRKP